MGRPRLTDPVLHLLAGPNGSGKSTLVTRVLQPETGLPFVNADVIAAREWPGAQAEHAYDASQLAANERDELIAHGASFITETVFSHPSKVDLVRTAHNVGYLVHLHVIVMPENLCVARVAERVLDGGHSVPADKIRQRHARLWNLVVQARDVADRTTFYDNSRADEPFQVVAEYEKGALIGAATWPAWTATVLRTD